MQRNSRNIINPNKEIATCEPTMKPSMMAVVVVMTACLAAMQVGEGNAMEICNMDAMQLAGCLPAIRGPSPQPPTSDCCSAVRTADLRCLCGYKDSPILRAAGVDPKLAMALPSKCQLTPPPECDEP